MQGALVLFLALALQIQTSLFAHEASEGIRLALSDLALPFAGVFILCSLFLKKSVWPRFQAPFSYGWIALLIAVMIFALLHGYLLSSEWSRWALLNKFAGFFVLIAYLGLGAWIAANADEQWQARFFKIFIGAFLVFSTIAAIFILIRAHCDPSTNTCLENARFYQLEALMGNRNAYALLFASIAALVSVFSARLPKWLVVAFWTFAPAFVMLCGSRALWIIFPALLIFAFARGSRSFLRLALPALVAGAIIFASIAAPRQIVFIETRLDSLAAPMSDAGDQIRAGMTRLALETWREHKILGSGLGGLMRAQDAEKPYVLDNTALWLLAETGLAGFLAFAAAFIVILIALFKRKTSLASGVVAMVLTFAVFSLAHEIMYTRFLWFFLGLSLSVPRTRPA